ncbi:MAG TPA: hypothetical protein VHX38_23810 [Pseudonocardiaceae bacterium]|nr:hypothetical protein [Pseudonocardiaceae bacterium]
MHPNVDSGAWRPVPAPPPHSPAAGQGQPPSAGYPRNASEPRNTGYPQNAGRSQDPDQHPDSGGDAALQAADEAVAALEGLAELPVTEHVARFDLAHAALTEALASIDKV